MPDARPRPSIPHVLATKLCNRPGMLSATYVLGLLACLVIGTIKGPDVFERSPPAVVETNSLNVTWYGKIDLMERWHQASTTVSGRGEYLTLPEPCALFGEEQADHCNLHPKKYANISYLHCTLVMRTWRHVRTKGG